MNSELESSPVFQESDVPRLRRPAEVSPTPLLPGERSSPHSPICCQMSTKRGRFHEPVLRHWLHPMLPGSPRPASVRWRTGSQWPSHPLSDRQKLSLVAMQWPRQLEFVEKRRFPAYLALLQSDQGGGSCRNRQDLPILIPPDSTLWRPGDTLQMGRWAISPLSPRLSVENPDLHQ